MSRVDVSAVRCIRCGSTDVQHVVDDLDCDPPKLTAWCAHCWAGLSPRNTLLT